MPAAKREREESVSTQVHNDSDSDDATMVEEIRPAPPAAARAWVPRGCAECLLRDLRRHSETPSALVGWVIANLGNSHFLHMWSYFCNAQTVAVLRTLYREMFHRYLDYSSESVSLHGWTEALEISRIALLAKALRKGAIIPWFARERELLLQYT